MGSAQILKVQAIEKSFDENKVLRGISFDVNAGECVALVGENGAGKSTLMKILSGVWPYGTYTGQFQFEGESAKFKDTLNARSTGISIIHQELCLFPELTVAENLFLTEEFPFTGAPSKRVKGIVPWRFLNQKAQDLLDRLGFAISAKTLVKNLSIAEKQLIEIARAIHQGAKLLILDEPTSALTDKEIRLLFTVLQQLKQKGTALIYISHKLEEIFEICERIVVLRDGQSVADLKTSATQPNEIISYMVGRAYQQKEITQIHGKKELLLKVHDLSQALLKNVSFEVGKGEIVGVSGLMGSGRSELLKSILGVMPGKRSGEMQFLGKKIEWNSVEAAMQDGCGFVPEDRKKEGLFLENSVSFNATISTLRKFLDVFGFIQLNSERNAAKEICERMKVKFSKIQNHIRFLSGGNQQKVLLGRMVALNPKLLVLDEPTRGIDIGAKEEIYAFIKELAQQGVGILVVSSELPELLNLCHRVLVMKEGRLVADLENQGLTQEKIMSYATEGELGWSRLNT